MSKELIKQLIAKKSVENTLHNTKIEGLQLFHVSESIRCAPAVYAPSITVILSGGKEAIVDGQRHYYDSDQYICCTMPMPIETGTPNSSAQQPLLGAYITLDTRLMAELVLEIERTEGVSKSLSHRSAPQGLATAHWSEAFSEALYRLLLLEESPVACAILAQSRLRELYYSILTGESGYAFKQAFGVGNEIARAITYLSAHLTQPVTIADMANHVGMSRAVFHRKFKQATHMSPIQFIKSMRLNNAAMQIAQGVNVNVAAMAVGYVSSSQFSREFKRTYGVAPKQWSQTKQPTA